MTRAKFVLSANLEYVLNSFVIKLFIYTVYSYTFLEY